ncbi:MAG: type I methionyl aminopeptidase [Candidatus Magasanikbacteria bacterium]|nr:type I methionyl aminopeptidase [Candidatus Magasanikbacteria bacterium]
MSHIKKPEEIQYLIKGGKLMGEILEKLVALVAPGVSAYDIDAEAEKLIKACGGRPAFKGYQSHPRDPKFPSTICASVNEEVVHGIATKQKILREGDIFSIDIGMQWPVNCGLGAKGNGFFTDTALTVAVGKIPKATQQLLDVTKTSLEKGIAAMRIGGSIADIGKAVESYVVPYKYGIVDDLVGHGVGYAVHEDPRVPNYYDHTLEKWKIEPGLVIAIEPMITAGSPRVKTAADGWSISTVDKSLSAHFEHTIVVTESDILVVTRRPHETY